MALTATPRRRSTDLATRAEVARAFLGSGSPRLIMTATLLAIVTRLLVGSWSATDLVVVGVTLLLIGFVEWVIHLVLLHAPMDSFRYRRLNTGAGHRQHHLDPPAMRWILLRSVDAALFLPMIALWTALWVVPVSAVLGGPVLAPYLTGLAAAWVALAHYEWTHLLVHTAYRPRTRYYRRLARNHRLHHYRNEHHWLGVTSNAGDRVLGTLPRNKTDVPLSDTARTLT